MAPRPGLVKELSQLKGMRRGVCARNARKQKDAPETEAGEADVEGPDISPSTAREGGKGGREIEGLI